MKHTKIGKPRKIMSWQFVETKIFLTVSKPNICFMFIRYYRKSIFAL